MAVLTIFPILAPRIYSYMEKYSKPRKVISNYNKIAKYNKIKPEQYKTLHFKFTHNSHPEKPAT